MVDTLPRASLELSRSGLCGWTSGGIFGTCVDATSREYVGYRWHGRPICGPGCMQSTSPTSIVPRSSRSDSSIIIKSSGLATRGAAKSALQTIWLIRADETLTRDDDDTAR